MMSCHQAPTIHFQHGRKMEVTLFSLSHLQPYERLLASYVTSVLWRKKLHCFYFFLQLPINFEPPQLCSNNQFIFVEKLELVFLYIIFKLLCVNFFSREIQILYHIIVGGRTSNYHNMVLYSLSNLQVLTGGFSRGPCQIALCTYSIVIFSSQEKQFYCVRGPHFSLEGLCYVTFVL